MDVFTIYLDIYLDDNGILIGDLKTTALQCAQLLELHEVAHAAAGDDDTLGMVYTRSNVDPEDPIQEETFDSPWSRTLWGTDVKANITFHTLDTAVHVVLPDSAHAEAIGNFITRLTELMRRHEDWAGASVSVDAPPQLHLPEQLQAAGYHSSKYNLYGPIEDDTTVLFVPRSTWRPGSTRAPFEAELEGMSCVLLPCTCDSSSPCPVNL